MASIWNNRISVSIFGEAQGPAIGVTIDNLPPGEFIEAKKLHQFMERRGRPGHRCAPLSRTRSGRRRISRS